MSFFGSYGQTNVYHPMPDSNAVWTESDWHTNSFCSNGDPELKTWNFSQTIAGDTLLSGKIYHKIMARGNYNPSSCVGKGFWSISGPSLAGYYRQDLALRKVYTVSGGQELVLYDFNAVVGSIIVDVSNSCSVTVISVDSVLIGNNYRKRFNLSSDKSIVEGIGNTRGLFATICPDFENGGGFCFIQNGKTIYPDTNSSCQIITKIKEEKNKSLTFSITPNPSSGIFNIIGVQNEFVFDVYDINGKLVFKKTLSENKKEIDLSKNNKGIYYYKILDELGNSSQGILVLE